MPLLAPIQTLVHDLKKHDLIPSVIPEDFSPLVHLDISYPGQKDVLSPGRILTKEETVNEPSVAFVAVRTRLTLSQNTKVLWTIGR